MPAEPVRFRFYPSKRSPRFHQRRRRLRHQSHFQIQPTQKTNAATEFDLTHIPLSAFLGNGMFVGSDDYNKHGFLSRHIATFEGNHCDNQYARSHQTCSRVLPQETHRRWWLRRGLGSGGTRRLAEGYQNHFRVSRSEACPNGTQVAEAGFVNYVIRSCCPWSGSMSSTAR